MTTMNDEGGLEKVRLHASLQHIDVTRVDIVQQQVEATLSLTYVFVHPDIRWDPKANDNINWLKLETEWINMPKFERCARTINVNEVEARVRNSTILSDGTMITSTRITTTSACEIEGVDKEWLVTGWVKSEDVSSGQYVNRGKSMNEFADVSTVGDASSESGAIKRGQAFIHFFITRDPGTYLSWLMECIMGITTVVVIIVQFFVEFPMYPALLAMVFIQIIFLVISFATEGPDFFQQKSRDLCNVAAVIMLGHALLQHIIRVTVTAFQRIKLRDRMRGRKKLPLTE